MNRHTSRLCACHCWISISESTSRSRVILTVLIVIILIRYHVPPEYVAMIASSAGYAISARPRLIIVQGSLL